LCLHGFPAAIYHPDAALAHLAEQLPDLIVCDVRMPGTDGPALAGRIRDLGYDGPILLMSGEAPLLPELPAVHFLRKTIDTEELITAILRLLL
jgi:two-component system CheB/CheR fusion protein